MREAVIVSTARTPIGKASRGAFNDTHGADMAAHVIRHALERSGLEPGEIEDVILGCGVPEGTTGQNVARIAAVRAGLPITVGGETINRFCSSGLMAISTAAQRVIVDGVPALVAGGVESISLVKRNGERLRNEWIDEHEPALYWPMIETAEVVAERYGVSRERQDDYALISQQRTAEAQAAGYFDAEIVPLPSRKAVADKATGAVSYEDVVLAKDEGNRPDTTARGSRQAGAGARPRQDDHRRQREPALRRRLGLRGDGREAGRAARDRTAGVLPRHGRGRLRARRDGHRPGHRDPQAARAPRPHGR